MATLKRSEIFRKHTSRGRPPKPAKERQLKQRAAYQWRDARRIYLAGSFERWRKLKSRLQLKDSSLAWHLLETHDKGCCNCSVPNMDGGESSIMDPQYSTAELAVKDSSQFYPALVRSLRKLCLTYLQFEECVEVMGLICVEIDHKSKHNHSVKEVIRRALLPKQRTHERHQSEQEASEAELVASVLSTMGNKEGFGARTSDSVSPQVSTGSNNAVLRHSGHPRVSATAVGASLYSAQGHIQLPGTSWDRADACSDSFMSKTTNGIDVDKSVLPQNPYMDGTDFQQSTAQTVPTQTSSCASYRNYDETDHAAQPVGTHPVERDASASSNKAQPVAGLWQSLTPDQPACLTDHHVSCKTGETHKVVMSDDGLVSHVVQSGPVPNQVYRIDLSNHGEEGDREFSSVLPAGSSQRREEGHVGGGESRDRAASIESTDSFMEVGIVSKINHAQRLLASPTDQPSPEASPVSDFTHHTQPDPFPSQSSDPASALVSSAADPSRPLTGSSPHPNHTSVIKQVISSEVSAAVKAETAASSCDAISTGKTTTSKRLSMDEGDLPLDMSVVKEEEENECDGDEFVGRESVIAAQSGQQQSTNDTEVASHASTSPPNSTAGDAAAASSESSQLMSQVSSMQLLQHYTDRLLQQQQLNADLPSFYASPLDSVDSEDLAPNRKRKLSDLEDRADGDSGRGIPWPRKDMTQKEEYQYLELDPFMDFAEMTRLFPNMQQRTFYRWKRRIKDQFIFLEQQPLLTYAQFSQIFPQVKEHVFEHWQRRIAQGHRFLADASKSSSSFGDAAEASNGTKKTGSGEAEGGGTQKEGEGGSQSDSYVSQYIFLQKNLSLDADQFCKLFPEVPQHLYYVWRKQIFSDFLKLQANPKMTYQEFRKLASVTQDVFSIWKTHLSLMTNASSLMSTCSSLVSAPSPLSTATPTLPPVSLLAARAGKGLGAELAAWYASYAPLMGQVALPFWSPFSIMSSPPLPNALAGLRDSAGVDRDQSEEHPCGGEGSAERSSERDRSRRVSGSSRPKEPVSVEKGGEVDGQSPLAHDSVSGGGEGASSHRGRRQSLKPEHYYYLLNPDTSYISLTRVFPGVSAQRYGRWKRKVAAALALLEREPQCTDDQFALSFPNVPDEILNSWRERVRLGNTHLMVGDDSTPASLTASLPPSSALQPLTSASPALSGPHSRDSSLGPDAGGSTSEELPNFLMERTRDTDSDKSTEEKVKEQTVHEPQSGPSARKQFKMNRQEFHFVQRYPNIDFGTFSSHFPDVSVRTFYRWRRQIREAIDLLRTAPFMTLAEFQKLVPEVTEDVFEAWKVLVVEECRSQRESQATPPERSGEESRLSGDGSVSASSSSHSQQPQAGHTLDQGETDDGSQKSAEQTEVNGQRGSQETQDHLFQSGVSHTGESDPAGSSGQCRPEQWLVHMNPHLDFAELRLTYPDVSQRTFYRWKQEVHQVMDYMRDHPDVSYDDIASCLPEVSHQAFLVWQELIRREKLSQFSIRKVETETERSSVPRTVSDHIRDAPHTVGEVVSRNGPDDLTQEKVCGEFSKSVVPGTAEQQVGLQEEESSAGKARRQTRNEFVEVMLNPAMDYAEFARRYGTVSQRTFYRWRAHIRDWRAAIRADPHMDYYTFVRTARDVPEYVFRIWREWESRLENPHSTSTSSDGYEGGAQETSHPGTGQSQHSQPARGAGSASSNSEAGHSHTSQLEMLWLAYDYYQRHPDIHLEALSAVFPAVTADVFQQWKKSGDVMMEYIRSIPSTNFEDFHRLFTDVKEDVFNILKAKVLGQAPLALPSSSSSELTTSVQPVFPSSSQTSGVRPGSCQKEKVPGSMYDLEPGGKSTHSSLYQTSQSSSTYSTQSSLYHSSSAHSPRLQSSPVPATDNKDSARSVRIKQESSPTTPLPSFTETVSNLGRLSSMVQHRLSQTPPAASAAPSPSALLNPHSASTASSLTPVFSQALAGIMGHHSVAKVSASASHAADVTHLHQQVYPSVSPTSSSHRSVEESAAVTAAEVNRPGSSGEELQGGREERVLETSAHSSQRQRKLQRVEYMFVLQNPDVDVQEFLTRFPQVSLRTFYRWKREIREDQQAGGSGGGVL